MPGKYVFGKADFKVGTQPYSIAICDFNGDSIPDVAAGTVGDHGVSVLLGKPDGTMAAASLISTVYSIVAVACGDFNGDGNFDLAAEDDDNAIFLFPGRGDGTFGTPNQFDIGFWSNWLSAIDLDGDGSLDLVFPGGGGLSVLYGNGNGTFQPLMTYDVGYESMFGFAVADLNGDNRLDLAVAGGSGVSVLIAAGNRSFLPYTYYTTGTTYATDVAVADFDGDHIPDLAVLTGSSADTSAVAILKGVGNGTFTGLQLSPTGSYPTSIAVADLNADGKLDVVTADYYARAFSVLLGNGNGTFQPHVDYGTGDTPVLAVGDFNGDGVPDVMIAADKVTNCYANCQSGNLSIFLGNGTGSFPGTHYVLPNSADGLTAADMNGDHKPDFIFAVNNENDPPTVATMLNNGDGSFAPPVQYPASGGSGRPITGDFDRDGRQDVAEIASEGFTISILRGNGDGSLQAPVDYPAEAGSSFLLTADFSNDKKLDLVTVQDSQNTVSLLLGNGDGSFQAHHEYASGYGGSTAVAADLNDDGNEDLVVTTLVSVPPTILLGNGDGSFRAPYTCDCGLYASGATIGDFNGDGKLDLATTGPQGVTVALGNGDGTFQPPVQYPVSLYAFQMTSGDVDGDGKIDLIVFAYDEVDVLYGNGDGTFKSFVTYAQSSITPSGLVSDLTGSGATDLAILNSGIYPNPPFMSVFLNSPVIALYPNNFKFAPQVLGDTSWPQQFLISNPGVAPLKISGISIEGDFSQTNDCPQSLGAGQHCTVTATFTPTDLGLRTGSITVQDNALAATQVIHLSGLANSALKVSRTTASFLAPVGKTDSRQILLTNRGNTDIGINGVTLGGRDANQFMETNDCGSSLPAHSSCTLTLVFKPTKRGTPVAGVTIRDTDPLSPQQIVLHGIAR